MALLSRKPPRAHLDCSVYFLTFCTYGRLRCLHHKGVPEILVADLKFYSEKLERLIAYTIMPDHVHLMIEVGREEQTGVFLRDFKKHTSRKIGKIVRLHDSHLWQRGSMDHRIRTTWANSDFTKHFHYLFYNSQKHLSVAPKDFPYHNFLEQVENGRLDMDFCAFDEEKYSEYAMYEY